MYEHCITRNISFSLRTIVVSRTCDFVVVRRRGKVGHMCVPPTRPPHPFRSAVQINCRQPLPSSFSSHAHSQHDTQSIRIAPVRTSKRPHFPFCHRQSPPHHTRLAAVRRERRIFLQNSSSLSFGPCVRVRVWLACVWPGGTGDGRNFPHCARSQSDDAVAVGGGRRQRLRRWRRRPHRRWCGHDISGSRSLWATRFERRNVVVVVGGDDDTHTHNNRAFRCVCAA